jgi:hypothetical protein
MLKTVHLAVSGIICGWLAYKGNRYITKTLRVMKLTAFLLTCVSVTVFAEGMSQSVSFSGQNVSLRNVFSAIESQTGFVVFSSKDILSDSKPVTVSVVNEPLSSFLSLCLRNQSLSFSIDDKTIFVTKYGQKISLSEKDVPIEKILKKIQAQTNYKFLYGSQLLEAAPRVTISVKDAPIEEVLDITFMNQPLIYTISENLITISLKKSDKEEASLTGAVPPNNKK